MSLIELPNHYFLIIPGKNRWYIKWLQLYNILRPKKYMPSVNNIKSLKHDHVKGVVSFEMKWSICDGLEVVNPRTLQNNALERSITSV